MKSRLVSARASLDMYIDSIIDDHVHKKKPETGPDDSDLVDELLALYSDDTRGFGFAQLNQIYQEQH